MIPSINKFYGEQDARHRGRLVWHDSLLYPIRIKSNDDIRILDQLDFNNYLYVCGDPWVAIFDLSKEKDLEYFIWVRDRAVNGWFIINKIEYQFNSDNNYVYLEWVQYYYQFKPRTDTVINKGPNL